MRKVDARSLSSEDMEKLRIRAVKTVLKGANQTAIAEILGLSRGTIARWMHLYRKNGMKALKSMRRGRPKKIKLEEWQITKTVNTITNYCPDQVNLPWILWTRDAIIQMIDEWFGITVSRWTADRYLKRWGMMPHEPIKRALEGNSKVVQMWLGSEYRAIRAAAKTDHAEIHWADEASIPPQNLPELDLEQTETTPNLPVAGGSADYHMVFTLTNRGALRFAIYRDYISADMQIAFLRRLVGSVNRKIYLITNKSSLYRHEEIKDWFEQFKERITIFFLP